MTETSYEIPVGKVIALLTLAVVIGVSAMSYAASIRGNNSAPETTSQSGKQST